MEILVLLLFANPLLAQNPWKDVYTESAWEERDRWQRAGEIIDELNLKPGSQVADIGCHEGYMTVKLAARVGSTGKVWAVDIEQSKLDKLKVILEQRQLVQVQPTLGDTDNPKLPVNRLDGVLIMDTYHEMDEHNLILKHIYAALKPNGRLVLCEAIAEERRKATREVQEKRHELGMNYAIEDLVRAGFIVVKQQEAFVDRLKEKGDKMWVVVARKK